MDGFFQHQLQSVKQPDGTLELYDYATNSAFKTTTVWVWVSREIPTTPMSSPAPKP
jgi:hypothetical protein